MPRTAREPLGMKGFEMRGILLWVIGLPIPIIIILYLLHVI